MYEITIPCPKCGYNHTMKHYERGDAVLPSPELLADEKMYAELQNQGRAWRTSPPTESGWYWARWRKSDHLYIIKILQSAGAQLLSPGEHDANKMASDGDYTAWLGPLAVPEMPE